MLANRNFTAEFEEIGTQVWKKWSEGFSHYFSTNEDQYGPFRCGPTYPLSLDGYTFKIPAVDYAPHGGNAICNPNYYPHDGGRASLGNFRYPHEIKELTEMKRLFDEGNAILEPIIDRLTDWRREEAVYLLNLGRFISHCCTTTIHTKQWYIQKNILHTTTDEQELRNTVARMKELCDEEIRNAEETIPLVELDSRLGWEPTMEYMTDRAHLEWKIKATQFSKKQLDMYTDSLKYNY